MVSGETPEGSGSSKGGICEVMGESDNSMRPESVLGWGWRVWEWLTWLMLDCESSMSGASSSSSSSKESRNGESSLSALDCESTMRQS